VSFNKTSLNEFRGYVMAFVGVDTVPPGTDAIVNSLTGIKVEGRKNRSEIGVGAQPGWCCGLHWSSVEDFDLTPAVAAILCAALAIILSARNGKNGPHGRELIAKEMNLGPFFLGVEFLSFNREACLNAR
jgi:hypothetical protein